MLHFDHTSIFILFHIGCGLISAHSSADKNCLKRQPCGEERRGIRIWEEEVCWAVALKGWVGRMTLPAVVEMLNISLIIILALLVVLRAQGIMIRWIRVLS